MLLHSGTHIDYRVKDINKLEIVQRRVARFAKSDYRRTTSVSKLMDDLGWRTLPDRRKDPRLNLFGKAVLGKAISVGKLKQPTKVTRFSDGTTFTFYLPQCSLLKTLPMYP